MSDPFVDLSDDESFRHGFPHELLNRNRGFELAGEPVWMPNNRLFGLKKLPIRTI